VQLAGAEIAGSVDRDWVPLAAAVPFDNTVGAVLELSAVIGKIVEEVLLPGTDGEAVTYTVVVVTQTPVGGGTSVTVSVVVEVASNVPCG
jgi:hypothetical protein